MRNRLLTVLMLEDEESDCYLFEIAVENAHLNLLLYRVANAQKGIDYVAGRGAFADRRACPLPDVIVLDLIMPHASGLEFLKWRRTAPESGNIPVVVLTGAILADKEIQAAREFGANRLYVKPKNIHHLENIVREIYDIGLRHGDGDGNPTEKAA